MRILILIFLVSLPIIAQEKDNLEGTAPNFELENLEGDIIELTDFLGDGPILLSFWATWCKPCVEELKALNKIYKSYKDLGFILLAISTDSERSIAKVKPFISSVGYDFPVLLDTNSDIARLYYARQIPYTVLIDREGNILYSHIGYSRGDELRVEEIIKQQLSKEKVQNLY